MSNHTELPAHRRFAVGNAFQALETQVREFNFAQYSNGHTYSGLKPQEYIEIIQPVLDLFGPFWTRGEMQISQIDFTNPSNGPRVLL